MLPRGHSPGCAAASGVFYLMLGTSGLSCTVLTLDPTGIHELIIPLSFSSGVNLTSRIQKRVV